MTDGSPPADVDGGSAATDGDTTAETGRSVSTGSDEAGERTAPATEGAGPSATVGTGSDREPTADATVDDAAGADASADDGTGATATGAATVESVTLRSTNHWTGIASVSFVSAGLGVVLGARPLLLAAVVGVAYLAYANVTAAPEPRISVARRLSDESPDPGDTVTVTVTVTNVGSGTLPDLRLVEGVPEALSVVDGPARTATALRSGARVDFSYTVLARRGEYTFDELTALARNASGSQERELALRTEPTTMTCVPTVDATETVPLQALTAPYTGRVPTDSAGEGVEFAKVREYKHGDPLSTIDWNRYARDGSLATMEFREEQMATVVVLLDLRLEAYVQGGSDGPHAVDRGIDAAGRLFNSLLETGDRVGIAALSTADIWLAPGAGPTHRAKARHLLATHPALSPTPPSERLYVRLAIRNLVSRLSDDAQVVFCSPMADDAAAYVARALQVRDHPVTVVSPDPTRRETTGGTLAAVERSNRLNDLRTSGVRVLDWGADETLVAALERARRRWSA